MKEAYEIRGLIEHGLKLGPIADEAQKPWEDLLKLYLSLLTNRAGIEKIKPGLQKLHHYFHDSFESHFFQSELGLRSQIRRLGFNLAQTRQGSSAAASSSSFSKFRMLFQKFNHR